MDWIDLALDTDMQRVVVNTVIDLLKNESALWAKYGVVYLLYRGTRWCSWLRHCATSQKVAGLIPDGVFGIFH